MAKSSEMRTAFDSETFGRDCSFRLDKPVGSASISPCGRDIVLASKEGLHIIDLDSPYAPPRYLPHKTPWEVPDVQWSPFASRSYWIVSVSNQKALVWNVGLVNARSSVEYVLHAHSRAITDMNFSAHHPDILATTSIDSYIHCWDLRNPIKPAMTFADWYAGGTQVKWNRQDSHIVASSHDKYLKIWDTRKGATPLKKIDAHATKVYGVDWDRMNTQKVATSSLDSTIKIWDYKKTETSPEKVLRTPFPVWRARYTPFGHGLMALPQRKDYALHLYDLNEKYDQSDEGLAKPVYKFGGHQNRVKEFLWRTRGNVTSEVDYREYQLVSWGLDRHLRLHEVRAENLDKVGYRQGMKVKRTTNFTRRGAKYRTFRDEPLESEESHYLQFPKPVTHGISNVSLKLSSGFGSQGFMSAVEHDKTASVTDKGPISWMRGVKIGKRSTSPGPVDVTNAVTSLAKATAAWETFESLGEEITTSLDKFPKLSVDEIDVHDRMMVVSLSRSWASEVVPKQLQARISFPSSYPQEASPLVTVENPSSLDRNVVNGISADILKLTDGFLSQKRHSLEAILRYLIGEQTLQESLRWLNKENEAEDAIQIQDLDSSSDEDADFGQVRSPMDVVGIGESTAAVNNAHYNVPIPRSCGAVWACTGALVCFFPPKQKNNSLIGQNRLSELSFPVNSKELFESFGNLQQGARRRNNTTSTVESKTATNSDDFELSSSSSSSSSTGYELLNLPFLPAVPWNIGSKRDTAFNSSQKSGGETGFPSTTATKIDTSVSIFRFDGLFPAKQILAQQYLVEPGRHAAEHNIVVAREQGLLDLAETWTLCSHLLPQPSSDTVGSAAAQKETSADTEDESVKLRGRDSAIDLSQDFKHGQSSFPMQAVTSVGKQWLVDDILSRLERAGDIQALAMLTCVLSRRPSSRTTEERSVLLQRDGSSSATPANAPMVNSEAAVDSFKISVKDAAKLPVRQDSWSHSKPTREGTTSIRIPTRSAKPSLSASATPPGFKPLRLGHERKASDPTIVSTSPDPSKAVHRTGANFDALTSPLTKPVHFHSASSSPPNQMLKKRPSPTGSYMASTQPSSNWTAPSWMSRSSTLTEVSKPEISPTKSEKQNNNSTLIPEGDLPLKLSLKLLNEDKFREDAYEAASLLDPAHEAKYQMWRQEYANLLLAWDLPVQRTEILNFNQSLPQTTTTASEDLITKFAPTNVSANTLIALTTRCPYCSSLQSNHKRRKCQHCSRILRPALCTYCNNYIHGLASPCLNCGHSLHFNCRISVLADVKMSDECLTGCGCTCSEHETFEMPMQSSRPSLPTHGRSVSSGQNFHSALTVPPGEGTAGKRSMSMSERGGVGAGVSGKGGKSAGGDGDGKRLAADDEVFLRLTRALGRGKKQDGLLSQGLRKSASQIWRGG
ncbi:uncharacterized protein KY384_006365 [Bacidia gigantensis]|uniref:uncharacterized protein n=1 Tax=Bacidia gigantensis TaxID=2732470 RepID=UPI001D0360DA|nr:uncharacterized protein KY384_006365 [Bacidia gigantensis]KAG8528678.1 hypothetical protein KY384_006365 [Bacidia gigantensis]